MIDNWGLRTASAIETTLGYLYPYSTLRPCGVGRCTVLFIYVLCNIILRRIS